MSISSNPTADFHKPAAPYLLSHSVGLNLRSSQAHLAELVFQPWQQDPEQVWPNWLKAIDRFRQGLATLLNGEIEQFCPQNNLSTAFAKILQALPKQEGRNIILLSEQDFPSMGFVADRAQRLGYELRFLPKDMDLADLDQWQQQLGDDVVLTLLTHVYSNSGLRLDIESLCTLCRQANVLSVVDIAQSVGVMPIDLKAWDADFVLGSCVKWLCGGPGAGFMWLNPQQIAQCEPSDVGWFSHQNPFEFDIRDFRYHDSALRFWGGTPSVLPFALASHSLEYFAKTAVASVFEHNQSLQQKVISALDPKHLASPSQGLSGGTLIVNLGEQQASFKEQLSAAQVQYDERAFGIRLSPHIYTNEDEIDALIACLPY